MLGFLPLVSIIANIYVFQALLSLKKDQLFMKIYVVVILFNLLACFLFYKEITAELTVVIRILADVLLLILGYYFYKKELKLHRNGN